MFRYTLLLALLPAIVLASGDIVQTRPCSEGRPVPQQVRVDNCPSLPCELVRGNDANMEMDFSAPFDAERLTTRIMATALGTTAPFELPADRARACDWLVQGSCPVSATEDITYNLRMPVLRIYPRVSLVLEVSLVDEEDRTHACFMLDARVVGA